MKQVIVLGSTGSIGVNTLKVIQDHPEEFQVAGLAAGSRTDLLVEQAKIFKPRAVAVRDGSKAKELERALTGTGIRVLAGDDGVTELAAFAGADLVVVAITGAAALKPTLAAIEKGRSIGLANKETLVMAGELVMEQARRRGAAVIPIDSEHSAIFQCLHGHSRQEIRKILLTTSGGPLKDVPAEAFDRLTKSQVMNHPRWKMGPKITVDSATMMNKALEVIEARWLFDVPVQKVEVIVHPEAIVHSMVEFTDGSVLAQMGITDMRIPIQYAMSYPRRLSSSWPPLDLVEWKKLTFEAPKREKFPCLSFGYAASEEGGTAPAVLNAANEVCVLQFLEDGLPFVRIPRMIEKVLQAHQTVRHPSLDQILEADRWAREQVAKERSAKVGGVSR
ncbi:MAG: 1-deoxy-D-xylulose-5-phosphate reductoisomerase [Candidatus Omnitrophica bacterium]|nr:1-deoxy-D-xylulose-5-phosphate reductoisomerase [Candidatus Omnitrophota bacterium]